MSEAHIDLEHHVIHRIGWLRAAVLGANDGIISTASLIIGVSAASANKDAVLLAGVAGLVAGAMSMAAGEFVSVSSQVDTEHADLEIERAALAHAPEEELEELTQIYVQRGLSLPLAKTVATQLTAHDALGAHARDELGISELVKANPIQAGVASALSFAVGALLPLIAAMIAPIQTAIPVVAGASIVSLAVLGAVSARAGGAPMRPAITRIIFWGVLAMAVTAGIGAIFGLVV